MKNEFRTRLNYPDPFKPTGIEFDLPETALVTVKIFHNDGQEVKTIIENENYSAGQHKLSVNIESFYGGNYVYRITAKGERHEFSETRRIG
ncbi:MAG: T9SS type A sorting domain-containing protein [Bacteroidetes bacterium]|nr:MAG: T9SS type A sorting domain-containing protein [Bacteroidota bacterium]